MEHTALPWKRDQYGNTLDANGEIILLTGFALSTGHKAQLAVDNSDFVFRACNLHYQLVRALKFYADPERYRGSNQRIDGSDEFTPDGNPYLQDVGRDDGAIARAALTAAGA